MDRNTDNIIDKAIVEKVSAEYDKEFFDWGYCCTWDFLDYAENDFRVGMCCYAYGVESLSELETKLIDIADSLGLDNPVNLTYDGCFDDNGNEQMGWLQPINLVMPYI